MNYRHAYHVGCAGDVLKHAALALLINTLLQKDGPITVIDTHAGRGLYDLQSEEALKTGEAELGIHRVPTSGQLALMPYMQIIGTFNPPDTLRYYPGSPAILANLLRPTDTLIVNELHSEEASALRGVFKGDPQVQIHQRDAYELWSAMTPTKTPRGLVFVDPPFESPHEYQQIADTQIVAHKKWGHGVTMVWYPLKDQAAVWKWQEQLLAAGLTKLLVIEHSMYTEARSDRFNGSGLMVVNPPYTFVQQLPPLLDAIKNALAIDGEKPWTKLEWLDEESRQAASR